MNVEPAPPGSLVIEVEGGRYVVPPGEQWLIGRAAEANIRLVDDRVSRRHAVVAPAQGGWRLVDAGSSNGVFHCGQPVTELPITGDITVHLGRSSARPPSAAGARRSSGFGSAVACGSPSRYHQL